MDVTAEFVTKFPVMGVPTSICCSKVMGEDELAVNSRSTRGYLRSKLFYLNVMLWVLILKGIMSTLRR